MKRKAIQILVCAFGAVVLVGYQNCAPTKMSFTDQGLPGAADAGINQGSPGNGGGGPPGIPGGSAPACTLTSSNTAVLTTPPSGTTAASLAAICPSFGRDVGCGAVIILTSTSVSVYYTGQGAYDGADDTVVGVLNLSGRPLNALALSSNLDIMGFDGDGADTYVITGTTTKIPGNSMDTTGYGGPNAYYTNISTDTKSGTVNFVTPVAANGGTSYFALEEAVNSSTACLGTNAY